MVEASDRQFLRTYLPFIRRLRAQDNAALEPTVVKASFRQGEQVLNRQQECNGLVLVWTGQLRALYETEDGKSITLYRLLPGDVCILTASCVLKNITFEVTLEAEKDSDLYFIPASVLGELSVDNHFIKEYMSDMVAERFSEVMWVVEQMVSRNMGQRISSFLLEQYNLEETPHLTITHETIARNLGTVREVISRVLKYMEGEGLIKLSRGHIDLLDVTRLRQLAG